MIKAPPAVDLGARYLAGTQSMPQQDDCPWTFLHAHAHVCGPTCRAGWRASALSSTMLRCKCRLSPPPLPPLPAALQVQHACRLERRHTSHPFQTGERQLVGCGVCGWIVMCTLC